MYRPTRTKCAWLWCRTVFNVDPDTHIDNIEASEQAVLDGTSKWSCKIVISGEEHVFSCLADHRQN